MSASIDELEREEDCHNLAHLARGLWVESRKLREGVVMEWIPVSERLPDEGVVVLVYSPPTKHDWPDDIRMDFDCVDPEAPGTWLRHNENFEHYCAVALPEGSVGPSEDAPYTHWMPLPEPPEDA